MRKLVKEIQTRERRQKKSETFADVICERIAMLSPLLATARKKVVVAVADKKTTHKC